MFMISQIVTKYYRYMGNVYGIFIIRTKDQRTPHFMNFQLVTWISIHHTASLGEMVVGLMRCMTYAYYQKLRCKGQLN